jgi:hypothetical protein
VCVSRRNTDIASRDLRFAPVPVGLEILTIQDFNGAIGYEPNNPIQGFGVQEYAKAKALINTIGDSCPNVGVDPNEYLRTAANGTVLSEFTAISGLSGFNAHLTQKWRESASLWDSQAADRPRIRRDSKDSRPGEVLETVPFQTAHFLPWIGFARLAPLF